MTKSRIEEMEGMAKEGERGREGILEVKFGIPQSFPYLIYSFQ